MVRNVSTLRSSRGTYNPLITIIASLPMMVVGLSVPLGYVLTFLYFLFFDIIDKSITFVAETADTRLHFGRSAVKETLTLTVTMHKLNF